MYRLTSRIGGAGYREWQGAVVAAVVVWGGEKTIVVDERSTPGKSHVCKEEIPPKTLQNLKTTRPRELDPPTIMSPPSSPIRANNLRPRC